MKGFVKEKYYLVGVAEIVSFDTTRYYWDKEAPAYSRRSGDVGDALRQFPTVLVFRRKEAAGSTNARIRATETSGPQPARRLLHLAALNSPDHSLQVPSTLTRSAPLHFQERYSCGTHKIRCGYQKTRSAPLHFQERYP
jgi:hypothetical protein